MENINRRSTLVLGLVMAAAAPLFALAMPAIAAYKGIDQATLNLVAATATKGYADPGAATVTNIRKSSAINGSGYCGDVTVEGSDETTTFHVVLVTPTGGPSVLRLSDYPMTESDPQAATVHELMLHFGCVDGPRPPTI